MPKAELYPRSAKAHEADGSIIGRADIPNLLGRPRSSVDKWFERRQLPFADGPLIEGRATWWRVTLLAWAWREGIVEEDHVEAAQAVALVKSELRPMSDIARVCDLPGFTELMDARN